MPETKQKTVEEIEVLLKQPRKKLFWLIKAKYYIWLTYDYFLA